ncbi:MAG TPA: hypothetical protein VMU11_04330, partial [Verrucomicrobiae bacterium]|nr:hypothetical protein [Verrucomicrobiae bacterium]
NPVISDKSRVARSMLDASLSQIPINNLQAFDNIRDANTVRMAEAFSTALEANVAANGFKDTLGNYGTSDNVGRGLGDLMNTEMESGDFKTVTAMARDIGDLSGKQQEQMLNAIGAGLVNAFGNAYASGKTGKETNQAIETIIKQAVAVRKRALDQGRTVPAQVQKMLEDARTTLYSNDKDVRKRLPSSLKAAIGGREGGGADHEERGGGGPSPAPTPPAPTPAPGGGAAH